MQNKLILLESRHTSFGKTETYFSEILNKQFEQTNVIDPATGKRVRLRRYIKLDK